MQRRRFKQTQTLEERLSEEAARLREEAEALRPGIERDQLVRRARLAETGSHMNRWLAEDAAGVDWAAREILRLDGERASLQLRANRFHASQSAQPRGNKYGLSPDEVEVARAFTQNPKLSNDDKEKLYAEQRNRYRNARATGAYRDDQGSVRR